MMLFKNQFVRKLFTLFAGLIFLNMSFVLAEFAALEMKDNALVQNITNSGFEEEKETGAESGENDSASNELGFSPEDNLNHHHILVHAAEQRDKSLHNNSIDSGYQKIFCPPPEILSAS